MKRILKLYNRIYTVSFAEEPLSIAKNNTIIFDNVLPLYLFLKQKVWKIASIAVIVNDYKEVTAPLNLLASAGFHQWTLPSLNLKTDIDQFAVRCVRSEKVTVIGNGACICLDQTLTPVK
jgi:hypothetical protein